MPGVPQRFRRNVRPDLRLAIGDQPVAQYFLVSNASNGRLYRHVFKLIYVAGKLSAFTSFDGV